MQTTLKRRRPTRSPENERHLDDSVSALASSKLFSSDNWSAVSCGRKRAVGAWSTTSRSAQGPEDPKASLRYHWEPSRAVKTFPISVAPLCPPWPEGASTQWSLRRSVCSVLRPESTEDTERS